MDWDTTEGVLDELAGAVRARRTPSVRIAVLGVGLIGGSIGLAARRAGAEVVGFGRSSERLETARERGAIDAVARSLEDALDGTDACFACGPVGSLPTQVQAALDAAGPECVVTDVGSTKAHVVEAIADERFVGGHPVAGAETSGVENARADLFEGAAWYLTPSERSSGLLLERLHRLVRSFGATPIALDAATHDRLLATVSHLPHVLANVLVAQAARTLAQEDEPLPRVGPELSRRHPGGGREHRHLDRHLPGQPRRPGGRDRRDGRAPPGGGRLAAGGRPRCARRRGTTPPATTAGACSRPT